MNLFKLLVRFFADLMRRLKLIRAAVSREIFLGPVFRPQVNRGCAGPLELISARGLLEVGSA